MKFKLIHFVVLLMIGVVTTACLDDLEKNDEPIYLGTWTTTTNQGTIHAVFTKNSVTLYQKATSASCFTRTTRNFTVSGDRLTFTSRYAFFGFESDLEWKVSAESATSLKVQYFSFNNSTSSLTFNESNVNPETLTVCQ